MNAGGNVPGIAGKRIINDKNLAQIRQRFARRFGITRHFGLISFGNAPKMYTAGDDPGNNQKQNGI